MITNKPSFWTLLSIFWFGLALYACLSGLGFTAVAVSSGIATVCGAASSILATIRGER